MTSSVPLRLRSTMRVMVPSMQLRCIRYQRLAPSPLKPRFTRVGSWSAPRSGLALGALVAVHSREVPASRGPFVLLVCVLMSEVGFGLRPDPSIVGITAGFQWVT